MTYDKNNIFAKIIRTELPCDKMGESSYSICFKNIKPKSKVHLLVLPKGEYVNFSDFMEHATAAEKADLWDLTDKMVRNAELVEGGYRLVANTGAAAAQSVPHFHIHIVGGEKLADVGL